MQESGGLPKMLRLIMMMLLGSTAAADAQSNCRNILDAVSRLACYDKAAPPKQALSASVTSTAAQEAYATKLRTSFLDAGINIQVSIATSHYPGAGFKYPLP